ncbi:MAG: MarR family transcriptional regulator [Oscillospiraceae bacterium]|nr:MarR family transcriptional regulator [Oscillospiraceae bacterium]
MEKNTAMPDSLTSRFRPMEWRVTRFHDEALRPFGLNMYQAMSLIYIAWYGRDEAINQRSIEKFLYLSNPGVSKIISILEKKGYVVRLPEPSDLRSYRLRATESGIAFAQELNEAILRADRKILEPLTEEEQKTMLMLLGKIGSTDSHAGR